MTLNKYLLQIQLSSYLTWEGWNFRELWEHTWLLLHSVRQFRSVWWNVQAFGVHLHKWYLGRCGKSNAIGGSQTSLCKALAEQRRNEACSHRDNSGLKFEDSVILHPPDAFGETTLMTIRNRWWTGQQVSLPPSPGSFLALFSLLEETFAKVIPELHGSRSLLCFSLSQWELSKPTRS